METPNKNGHSPFLYKKNSSFGCKEQPLELFFMKNQSLLYAAIALLMFVGCNEDSQDNTDNKSEEQNISSVEEVRVTLDKQALSFEFAGDTVTLRVRVTPANASNKAVSWSSSNTAVAAVNDAGLVTAVSIGSADIVVTTADGSKTATCAVSVIGGIVVNNNELTDTIKLVNVEGGAFTMGCIRSYEFGGSRDGDDAGECYGEELPSHSVTLSSYKIGQFEVTQKLWRVVMGSLPSGTSTSSGQGDNYPVYYVNWDDDIQTFLTNLNSLTGKHFRLPTEAEWEYAARGGNQSQGYKYSGSNTLDDVAWYNSNSGNTTHIVGVKAANELGIYDMSGNVWELCADLYGNYSSVAQSNPTGAGSGYSHVLRSGSWNGRAGWCRVAFRSQNSFDFRNTEIGFRLVLPVE
jgi:formylglycine-generating enzyme required for sulfatase activity